MCQVCIHRVKLVGLRLNVKLIWGVPIYTETCGLYACCPVEYLMLYYEHKVLQSLKFTSLHVVNSENFQNCSCIRIDFPHLILQVLITFCHIST